MASPMFRVGVLSFSFFIISEIYANETPRYEYPELLAAPRATESLYRHAIDEKSNDWTYYLTIQVPSAINLFMGLSALNEKSSSIPEDPEKTNQIRDSALAASFIGGGWLTLSVLMTGFYEPYATGWYDIKKMPSSGRRDQLLRERYAEEHMEHAALVGTAMKHLSVWTNVAAGGMLASSSENDMTKIGASLAVLSAFGPYIFDLPWIRHYENQLKYKKHIYGPITQTILIPGPLAKDWRQMIQLTWKF